MLLSVGQRKKKSAVIALFRVLLFSPLTIPVLVNVVRANPTIFSDTLGTCAPDSNTKPPVVSVFAPANHTVYAANGISLSVNVSVGESSTASSKYISEIYYKADWQTSNFSIYDYNPTKDIYSTEPVITQFSKTLNLTGMPDGNHSLVVYAKERGSYYDHTDYSAGNVWYEYYYLFEVDGSSSVFFAVDTIAPSISVLSIEDKTYHSYDVQLCFAVNESPSRIAYSLDGKDDVAIAGNTTLTGLSEGAHNLTVFATDLAGNVGVSETITFTVAEPEHFPAAVAVASTAVVAVIGVSLAVYLTKTRKTSQKTKNDLLMDSSAHS
jgi:hypothetical protein